MENLLIVWLAAVTVLALMLLHAASSLSGRVRKSEQMIRALQETLATFLEGKEEFKCEGKRSGGTMFD